MTTQRSPQNVDRMAPATDPVMLTMRSLAPSYERILGCEPSGWEQEVRAPQATPSERGASHTGEARIGEKLHDAPVVGRARALAYAELAFRKHEPAWLLRRFAPLADVGLLQRGLCLRARDTVGHEARRALERGHGGDGARPGIAVRSQGSEVIPARQANALDFSDVHNGVLRCEGVRLGLGSYEGRDTPVGRC